MSSIAASSNRPVMVSSGSKHKSLKGTMLIDATLRDFIVRSPLWKYHVANTSLKWVIAKVSYADTLTPTTHNDSSRKLTINSGQVDPFGNPLLPSGSSNGKASTLAGNLSGYSALNGGQGSSSFSSNALSSSTIGETKRPRENETENKAIDSFSSSDDDGNERDGDERKQLYVGNEVEKFMAELDGVETYVDPASSSAAVGASPATSKKGSAKGATSKSSSSSSTLPSISTKEELFSSLFYSSALSSPTNQPNTEVDKPTHKAPHLLYMATFHETASSAAAIGLSTGNAYKTNELLNGSVHLRPELFVCLLLRVLQLAKNIHSLQIVEMVEQTHSPVTVSGPGDGNGDACHNLNGSKYLRVFGLFLARLLLAYREEPLLLKRCYDAAKTDFRRVRVMTHAKHSTSSTNKEDGKAVGALGGREENPICVMRVDEVAHILMTTDRWGRIAFPPCKSL